MPGSGEKIPESYSVVEASSTDAEQIGRLIHDSWVKTMHEALGIPVEQLEEALRNFATEETPTENGVERTASERRTFVAKNGDTVLGVCTVVLNANKEGENELLVLHVRPDKTASGIGSALWRTAEKVLDPMKHTFLWTTPGTDAVRIYEKWGFKPVEYGVQQLPTREPSSRPRVKMVRQALIDKAQ